MADNIDTPVVDGLAVAAKDIGGVLYPRNILTKADGTDIDPATSTAQATAQTSLSAIASSLAGTLTISGAVTGTFFQATQPVSGTFWQATQPVSGTVAVTGVSTAAKQPALGTAGTASSDVLTVQGVASMTPLLVNGSGVTQPVSGTFWQATQPVSGTFWQATQPVSGTVSITSNSAVNVAQINGVTTLMGNGATGTGSIRVTLANDSTGIGIVTETAPASDTASSGLNGRMQRVAQNVTTMSAKLPASLGATTASASLSVTPATDAFFPLTRATTTSRILSAAASTNATSAKASAGTLRGVQGYNARASAVYLKFYNKASSPTVGTDTPVKTIYLPASTPFAIEFNYAFSTGIAYALTTGGADADTGALTAADILGLNVDYL